MKSRSRTAPTYVSRHPGFHCAECSRLASRTLTVTSQRSVLQSLNAQNPKRLVLASQPRPHSLSTNSLFPLPPQPPNHVFMSDIFLAALVSGAFAGFAVDVSLYPIDTLKTRLQSPKGFLASGGFTGIYRGLGSVAIGSAPGAALFFTVYETSKFYTPDNTLGHMMSASFGEIAACLVRVPTENVKTRMQINSSNSSLSKTVKQILKGEGVRNMYNGFGITLMREIPFAFIQVSRTCESRSVTRRL